MSFAFQIDVRETSTESPIFLRIARSISEEIRRGRLRPGHALPGTRTLAESLGVHRNTVIAAYRELEAEGWVAASAAKATVVSLDLPPDARRSPWRSETRSVEPAFDLGPAIPRADAPQPPRGAIALLGGLPDLSMVPSKALASAYRRALVKGRAGSSALGYGDPRGEPRLRELLAEMIARVRGVATVADEVLVTRGSQMALFLAARALVRPGDAVAVEAWGYKPAWDALTLAGAELHPIPVDAAGMDVDALARLLCSKRMRAVYLTPHHQYPTTVLLSQARRHALLELARRERFAILEDDYDHEFHYDGRPVLPLASADRHGSVIYLGTLSKIFAPGIRLGFVSARPKVVERMTALRVLVDRQGDLVVERAMAELMEDGEIERHARRMRRVYASRREALVEALRSQLGDALEFDVPPGGMALWARAPGVDVEAWAARAAEQGVLVQTAKRFAFDGRARSFLRIGFASESEPRIRTAVERLAATLGRK